MAGLKESFLTTHPHVRRIIFGACILVTVAALGTMFGWDRVGGWIERGAESLGFEIGSTETTEVTP